MQKPWYRRYWKGLVFGFLFGTVGLWILSVLSLFVHFFEIISTPFLVPGRLLSSQLITGNTAGDGVIIVLTLANGLFYALLGFLIQNIAVRTKER